MYKYVLIILFSNKSDIFTSDAFKLIYLFYCCKWKVTAIHKYFAYREDEAFARAERKGMTTTMSENNLASGDWQTFPSYQLDHEEQ